MVRRGPLLREAPCVWSRSPPQPQPELLPGTHAAATSGKRVFPHLKITATKKPKPSPKVSSISKLRLAPTPGL